MISFRFLKRAASRINPFFLRILACLVLVGGFPHSHMDGVHQSTVKPSFAQLNIDDVHECLTHQLQKVTVALLSFFSVMDLAVPVFILLFTTREAPVFIWRKPLLFFASPRAPPQEHSILGF